MTFESGENFLAKLSGVGDELLVFPFLSLVVFTFFFLLAFLGNGLDNEARDFIIIYSWTELLLIDHQTFLKGVFLALKSDQKY